MAVVEYTDGVVVVVAAVVAVVVLTLVLVAMAVAMALTAVVVVVGGVSSSTQQVVSRKLQVVRSVQYAMRSASRVLCSK